LCAKSEWQSLFAERVIRTIRRECLEHVVVVNERHLCRTLSEYLDCYHKWLVHRSLNMDCPEPREVHEVNRGRVIGIPAVGGLHHHYERIAA